MARHESHRRMMVKVSVFTVAMLLVAVGLVVIFGEFRFGPESTYHATFTDATRLKPGQKVRIAGVPVGSVKGVKLNTNNSVDVTFGVDKRYTLYSSTRAMIRYENLVGDRYLEITLAQEICVSCRPAGPSISSTRNRRSISMPWWADCGRCSRAWMRTRSTRSPATSSSCCRAKAGRCRTCSPIPTRSPRR